MKIIGRQVSRDVKLAVWRARPAPVARRKVGFVRAALVGSLLLLAGCGSRSELFVSEERAEPRCPDGATDPAWVQVFGGPAATYDEGGALAVDTDGSMFVAGVGSLTAPPCDGFESRGRGPGFLAKLDPRGSVIWEWRTALNNLWGTRVAADGEGGVLFVIGLDVGEDVGAGLQPGGRYLGRADADGNPVFLKRLEAGGIHVMAGVDASPTWGVAVASSCVPPVAEDPTLPAGTALDVAEACKGAPPGSHVVNRFGPYGDLLWTEVLTTGAPELRFNVSGVAFTETGGVVVAGLIAASLTHGDGTVDSVPGFVGSPDREGIFLARYDEEGGLVAHRLVAGVPAQGLGALVDFPSVAVDPVSGAIFFGASLAGASGSFDLGNGPVENVGAQTDGTDVIARLGPDLEPVWSFGYGGDTVAALVALQSDGEGGVIALSNDIGPFQAGGLTSEPPTAYFTGYVTFVSGDGVVTAVHSSEGYINAVASGTDGQKIITGCFDREADFGAGPVSPDEAWVLKGFLASGPFW